MKIVIESPLAGDFARNLRFLLWCCRAVWQQDGAHAIASHLICPWFLDDTVATERAAGIAWEWTAQKCDRWFFDDLGMSPGMVASRARHGGRLLALATYAPDCWRAFVAGDWPPHTPGFELAVKDAAAPDVGWRRDDSRQRAHYFRGARSLCGRVGKTGDERGERADEQYLRCRLCGLRAVGR